MRLFSGVNAGRESLLSHGIALNAVSDNLANTNTPGFKANRTDFSSIYAEGNGGIHAREDAVGGGVSVPEVRTIFQQGSFEFTSRNLDAAIDGNGFFVISDGTDEFYTRAGNFEVDVEGNLIVPSGEQVLGFTDDSPDELTALTLANIGQQSTPTSTATLVGNLDAREPVTTLPVNPTTFQDVAELSQFVSTLDVVDALGAEHSVLLHYFKTAENTWTIQAYANGEDVGLEAGTPALLGTGTAQFDGTGAQVTPATFTISPAWANGAAESEITLNLAGFSQFAAASVNNSLVTDGLSAGTVTEFSIGDEGNIVARLDNGAEISVGQLAIADFVNVDGLERRGNGQFREGATSGERTLGTSRSEGLGNVQGGQIEIANVDPSTEFINILRFQRGYQAGSTVVDTLDQLIEQTINIL